MVNIKTICVKATLDRKAHGRLGAAEEQGSRSGS